VILNIAIMDIIFSLDSVITAVGMVGEIPLMVTAIVIAMGVMVIFADPVSEFVNEHASVKILALSFLLMIGVLLTAEAFEVVVPKGYVYFAMAFSLTVEFVQMRYETNLERRNRGRAKNAPAIQE
jgi:predicted tellurium resistance membrane protein TerC